MGADNLIHFHLWQKWQSIFNDISIVIFKRHGYNIKALKSIAFKRFKSSKITKINFIYSDFNKTPSWCFIENKEINISSTEIRKQRDKFRGKN